MKSMIFFLAIMLTLTAPVSAIEYSPEYYDARNVSDQIFFEISGYANNNRYCTIMDCAQYGIFSEMRRHNELMEKQNEILDRIAGYLDPNAPAFIYYGGNDTAFFLENKTFPGNI